MMARGDRAALRTARAARTADEYDESFAAVPNLVVIDGGKGQLAAALEAMQASACRASRSSRSRSVRRRSYVPGRAEPVVLAGTTGGPAAAPAHPRRGAPLRARVPPAQRDARAIASILDTLEVHRPDPGARSCTISARPTAFSQPRRRSSRPSRGCLRRRGVRCSVSSTARAAGDFLGTI